MSQVMRFPRELATIIAEYAVVPKLLDWIDPKDILKEPALWANSEAYEAGLLDLTQMDIYYHYAAKNPALLHLIKARPVLYQNTPNIWENEAAYEWLMENGIRPLQKEYMIWNNHPIAIASYIADIEYAPNGLIKPSWKLGWLRHPNAWPWLYAHRDLWADESIWHYYPIFANPCAIELIKRVHESGVFLDLNQISQNPHPWAIDYCRERYSMVPMHHFAANPGIFARAVDPLVIEAVMGE